MCLHAIVHNTEIHKRKLLTAGLSELSKLLAHNGWWCSIILNWALEFWGLAAIVINFTCSWKSFNRAKIHFQSTYGEHGASCCFSGHAWPKLSMRRPDTWLTNLSGCPSLPRCHALGSEARGSLVRGFWGIPGTFSLHRTKASRGENQISVHTAAPPSQVQPWTPW